MPLGVLIYAGAGVWGLLIGATYLESNILSYGNQLHGQERGVFWVEIGVLITVSSTMITIFYAFAGRGRQ